MKKKEPLLGAHVSIAGGFHKAIEEGQKIDCNAVQIFTKSNRQWKAKPIDPIDAEKFIIAQKNSPIKIVVAHASYLINLGSKSKETQEKSYNALVEELKRCDSLKIPYLILHPGTAEPGTEEETAILIGEKISSAINATKNTAVLVETMAGQGKSIGHTLEKLSTIVDQVSEKSRIGVCLDTCHIFAAGYDLSSQALYKKFFDEFQLKIGIDFIKTIHINDSKKPLNSRVDRHEHIGQGEIGIEVFSQIMNDPQFKNIPKILETPKENEITDDLKNLKTLKDLLK